MSKGARIAATKANVMNTNGNMINLVANSIISTIAIRTIPMAMASVTTTLRVRAKVAEAAVLRRSSISIGFMVVEMDVS